MGHAWLARGTKMEITTRECSGLGLRQTCERGIASGLTRLHCGRFKRAWLLVGHYVLPALCAIAIGLGGCTAAATAPGGGQGAAATAPGGQDAAATASDTALPECPATLYAGKAWSPNQEEARAAHCRQAQSGSCLTDYFLSTKRPLCTAVDWLVVLPVVLFIAGAGGPHT
jgi:hypothetical protein